MKLIRYTNIYYILLVASVFEVHSIFEIPEVKFEALKSGGFRAYIPDSNAVTFFVLNANLNKNIGSNEPGQLSNETRIIVDHYLILNFAEKLRIRDVLNYWIFVNANRVGYKKERLVWEVTELLNSYPDLQHQACVTSKTTINGNNVCQGELIFEDEFEELWVNINKWVVEQKIPTYVGPNFEFNSYENSNNTCFVQNGVLYLKPVPVMDENEVRGELNLRNGCTSSNDNECYYKYASAFLLPPVKSAKIISKHSIKYGRIEIRAQLPAGDWIFPIIQLEVKDGSTQNTNSIKVLIAYSRGNNFLRTIDVRSMNLDIGSRQLTAGPVVVLTEPGRSKYTVTTTKTSPLNNQFHNYSLLWLPDKMQFYVDGVEYGTVLLLQNFTNYYEVDGSQNWMTLKAIFNQEFKLSLGVAVGGLNDFPDGYNSEFDEKPWINDERNYIKKFFDARNSWSRTWINDKSALRIDYVKIWAI